MEQQEKQSRQRRTTVVGRFFGAAVCFLLVGSAGLVWIAPELSQGLYLSPHVAGVTHAFTLGFLTLTIFGALAQLLPVALGAQRYSARTSGVALWLLVPGVALFATGVAASKTTLLVAGVSLVAAGILVNLGAIAVGLAGVKQRSVTWFGVALGGTFLLITLVFGSLLADNLSSGFLAASRVRILAAHLHLALVGWVLIVIVGVAHRILPMFLAAPSVARRLSAPAMALLACGALALACGLASGTGLLTAAGAGLLIAGDALFLFQGVRLFRGRTRPLHVGMQFVAIGFAGLGTAAALGPFVILFGPAHTRLAAAYVVSAVLVGLVPFVIGIMYEIEPTVSWNTRFAGRLNRGVLPAVTDLYSHRAAELQFTATVLGAVLLVAGIAAGSAVLVRGGALAYCAANAVFAFQVARIRWGRPPAPVLVKAAA